MMFPSFIFKVERWKFNKDFGVYVSTLGHFKDRHKRALPIRVNQSGYCAVKTECDYVFAHRLVMFTWRPIPNAEILTVDHLDHNKRNNSLDNLEWVTREENYRRANVDFIPKSVSPNMAKWSNKEMARRHYFFNKTTGEYFENAFEAAQWILMTKNMRMNDNLIENTAIRLVQHAKRNETYYDYKWEMILNENIVDQKGE